MHDNNLKLDPKDKKHIHTVLLYLLGVCLQEVVEPKLQKFANAIYTTDETPVEPKLEFMYVWFLTSLFHDMGNGIENEKNYALLRELSKTKSLKGYLKKKHKISHNDLFDYLKENNLHDLILEPYDKIIESYFDYRKDYFHVVDHGIIAGYLFFDRLKKNHEEAWKDYLKNRGVAQKYKSDDYFEHKDLVWSKKLLLWFAYISQNIMAHNIWKSESDEDDKKYTAYGLEDLTREKFQPICIDKSPLLFFLCLLDTIEPTKRFTDDTPKDVWENIDITYCKGTNEITIKPTETLMNMNHYNEWLINICKIPQWLNSKITIEYGSDKHTVIKIKIL